jgi:hypothetical protein
MAFNYNWLGAIAVPLIIVIWIVMKSRKKEPSLQFETPITKARTKFIDDDMGECEVISIRRTGSNEITLNLTTKSGQGWWQTYQRDTVKPVNVEATLVNSETPVYKGVKWNAPRSDARGELSQSEVAEAQKRASEAESRANYAETKRNRDIFEILDGFIRGRGGGGGTTVAVKPAGPGTQ